MASFNPFAMTVRVGFPFPNRNAGFDGIDQLPAGPESFLAMTGGSTDPHGQISRAKITHRMDGSGANAEFERNLLHQPAAFLQRQFQIGLIAQTRDIAALVVIPNAALKKNKSSAIRSGQRIPQGREIDGMGFDEKRHGSTSRKGFEKNNLVAGENGVLVSRELVVHRDPDMALQASKAETGGAFFQKPAGISRRRGEGFLAAAPLLGQRAEPANVDFF
jgi:hypothetical protein